MGMLFCIVELRSMDCVRALRGWRSQRNNDDGRT